MPEQPFTKPNAVTFSLEDLVNAALEGRLRIPDFQRSFRWQWEDVRRLLDSIVRGYPVGSLLLWSREAKAARLTLGALTIDAPATEEALWVVDGQQRLTSLASALNEAGTGDPRFAISYDLANRTFSRPSAERFNIVPLPTVFDLQRLLKWFAEHPESQPYFDEATRAAKAIRQYSIPAYIVKQKDEAVLRDIFDRMNNYGKRLTRAEVFSALHAGEHDKGPPRTLSDIVEHIDATYGFGEVDEDTALCAVLARRGPDVTRDIRTEFDDERQSCEFPGEAIDDAYRGGEEALSAAVRFLQEEAAVPHFGFLTYRYLLVVLTRFFAHHPRPARRNVALLRRWFWRAAIIGPEVFSGWTQAMRALASNVSPSDEDESVQSLLGAVKPHPQKLPIVTTFRSTSASSRMLLCALWSLEPRSVLTGEPYGRHLLAKALEGRPTAVDIVYTILRREPGGRRAQAANRCILLGDDSQEEARSTFANPILGLSPSVWKSVLESHALDEQTALSLSRGDDAGFLAHRGELLTSITSAFLRKMTETQLEDTPPLESLDLDEDEDPSDAEA